MNRYAITATLVLPALALFAPAAWAQDGGSWTAKTDMPTGRRDAAAGVVNGKLYVIGGYAGTGYLGTCEEYDPATNSWTAKTSMSARRKAAAGVVNDKVYVIGGNTGSYLQICEEYDPATNTWSSKTPMPTARTGATAGVVDGKIYVIGGNDGSNKLSICEQYDPMGSTWASKTPMPTARMGATASVVNGKIYVIGGYGDTSYLGTCEEYNPATNTWTPKTSMNTPRVWATSGAVNGMIYVVGGEGTGNSFLATCEQYDPVTNSWTTMTPMNHVRQGPTAGVVNSKLYVIGGEYVFPVYQLYCEEYTPPVTNVPPSITTQPESVTVDAGATANFTAAADGTPAPIYQWQQSTDGGGNWTDIPGATGTTYTTPATVPGDDGTRFRCVATNVAGVAFSQAAVLSIRTAFSILLSAGYNLIALPFEPATPYTASSVLAGINTSGEVATRILRFTGSGYDVYTSSGVGIDFDVKQGEGYFLRCSGPGAWTVTAKE